MVSAKSANSFHKKIHKKINTKLNRFSKKIRVFNGDFNDQFQMWLPFDSFSVDAIKCWQCTSHVPFCNDEFNPHNVTEQQKGWALKECILSDGQSKLNQIAVCKKLKQIGTIYFSSQFWCVVFRFNSDFFLVYDKFVVTRSCYWMKEVWN